MRAHAPLLPLSAPAMAPWAQALHVIGIILWMGGLFQLARHLGQHAKLEDESAREAFAEWERKTYYIVVLPGLLLTLGTGLHALFDLGFGHYLNADGPWGPTFHLKFLLIAILLGADQFVHFKMRSLHDDGEGSSGPFMAVHGLVALFFIVIVLLMKMKLLV